MNAKAKSNSIVTHEVDANGVITYTVLGVGELTFDRNKAAAESRLRAETHGWIQRHVDAAAIGVTDANGNMIDKAVRSQMKYEAMRKVIEHYESGATEWNLKGGSGGGRSLVIEAVARVMKTDYTGAEAMVQKRAEAKFGGDVKKTLAKLRESRDVQAAILDISRERLPAAAVDADEELAAMQAD